VISLIRSNSEMNQWLVVWAIVLILVFVNLMARLTMQMALVANRADSYSPHVFKRHVRGRGAPRCSHASEYAAPGYAAECASGYAAEYAFDPESRHHAGAACAGCGLRACVCGASSTAAGTSASSILRAIERSA
jgi:hypothetical protein